MLSASAGRILSTERDVSKTMVDMVRSAIFILTIVALGLLSDDTLAESWECGGARIHCGGSAETCAAMRRACSPDLQSSSEVDRELMQAVREANTDTVSPQTGDPFERLSRSMMFQRCGEQQAKEGRCGVFRDAKELVAFVVDTLKYSVDAINQASRILRGEP